MSVQGCPVDYSLQASVKTVSGGAMDVNSVELAGTTERLIASYRFPYPAEERSERTSSDAAGRQRKRLSWLSKFAGWSGHAALMSNCPEFFAAGSAPA